MALAAAALMTLVGAAKAKAVADRDPIGGDIRKMGPDARRIGLWGDRTFTTDPVWSQGNRAPRPKKRQPADGPLSGTTPMMQLRHPMRADEQSRVQHMMALTLKSSLGSASSMVQPGLRPELQSFDPKIAYNRLPYTHPGKTRILRTHGSDRRIAYGMPTAPLTQKGYATTGYAPRVTPYSKHRTPHIQRGPRQPQEGGAGDVAS